MLKECVFSTCSRKMASSDDEKKLMEEERDFFTSTLYFCFTSGLFGKDGVGVCVCAERDLTQ